MKINDIIIHNNKQWKIIAIKGDYVKIRLIGKRADKIVKLGECLKWN